MRLHLWRFWDVVRLFVIAIGAFVFCLFVLEPVMPGWLAGWICLGLFVAGILVVYAWNRYFPPAFNVCNLMGLGIVDYEFRDEELAEEFRELNQADVIEDWP